MTTKPEQPTVLIIDDDEIELKRYVDSLEQGGFKVLHSLKLEHGISQMEDVLPDVVVCDLRMVTESGLELLSYKQASDNQQIQQLPVVILTSIPQDEYAQTAIQLGAQDVLVKSQSQPEELVELVRKLTS